MSSYLRKTTVQSIVKSIENSCPGEVTNCGAYECGWQDACERILSSFEHMDGFSSDDIRAGKPDLIEAETRLALAARQLAATKAVVEKLKQHFEE